MKVLLINSVCGIGSTGRICANLAQEFEAKGDEVKIAYGRDDTVPKQFRKYAVKIGTGRDLKMHAVRTRLLDEHGFGSKQATKKFLEWAEGYKPDLLWLHNIHGYYINVEMLFVWIKTHPEMQVKWTLHDCWAFTGHCSHFTLAKCEQWKKQCTQCPQKREYPKSLLKDGCQNNFDRKRKAFCGVTNLILITPSKWIANLAKQSFLKEYQVEVHYNTIDTSIFKPTPSDFRKRYGLQNKKVVLGVASTWNERKGLRDFVKLAAILDDTYRVVLVGLTEKQIGQMPKNVIGLRRTNSPKELAKIYTAADVFANLSYEENYPTVNLEAQACGIPVVAYDTGGVRETFVSNRCFTTPIGDIVEVSKRILGSLVKFPRVAKHVD